MQTKHLFLIISALLIGSRISATVNFQTQPYLQDLTPTSVTIMWVVGGSDQQSGWVEYGEGNLNKQAFGYTNGLKQAFTRLYKVHIDSLQPGTTYTYRAMIREIVGFVGNTALNWGDVMEGQTYSFTTPVENAATMSCLVFNDLHGHPEYIDSLIQRNHLSFGAQDFVMLNGDILNSVPTEAEIVSNMLQPMAATFAAEKPFFFTRGNHEYRNKAARLLPEYFSNGEEHTYFAFSWGPCRIIVLDTGEDKEDAHPEYNGLITTEAYRQEQVAWLQEQLTSTEYQAATFHLVFMHIPFYSNTNTARFAVQDCRNKFLAMMNQYGVDLAISGHTHKAGILAADDTHTFPIVIGGGKDVTNDKRPYCPAVITLTADQTTLQVNILNYYGETVDTLSISVH